MRQSLESRGMKTEPPWILRTDGQPGHISGELRELTYVGYTTASLEALLDTAAEQLDDAHEDWLEAQDPAGFRGML